MSAESLELKAQLRLATPVVVVNLAMMGMGVVDSMFMGHESTLLYAAVSLGHSLLWVPLSFGLGLILALDPLVAQAHGAGDNDAVARALQRGLALALALGFPIGLMMLGAPWMLRLLEQPEEVIPAAASYARITSLGAPALLVFFVLRQSLQALGGLRPIVVVALAANVLNVFLDWLFISGGFGLPRFGATGCAWATTLCDLAMAGGLLWLSWSRLGGSVWPLRSRVFAWLPMRRMLALGLPIGIALVLETAAFNAVAVVMGWFGTTQMAANRTVIVLASVSFMVPLGLSTAAAVRVGHAVGAGDEDAMRRAARVSLACGAVVMLGFASLFLLLPGPLSRLFSAEPDVLALAISLLPVVAAFELFDGLQVVASGVLRGVGDTRWPMVVNLVGYWVLGLPIGLVWVRYGDGGPAALWWALGAALGFVALALLLRVRRRLGQAVSRIDLGDVPGPGLSPGGEQYPVVSET